MNQPDTILTCSRHFILRFLSILFFIQLPLVAAVSEYLDFEPPDSSLDTGLRILENNKTYTREAYQDAYASAAIVSSTSRDGTRSLQVTHNSNSGTDKDRMEWNWHNWNPGGTYWSGFGFGFDPGMEAPVASSGDCLMHQWKNQQAGYTASLMLLNKTNKSDPLELRVKLGYGPTEAQRAYHYIDPGYVFTRGQWYDVVVNYKITCSGANDSFFKVWINGTLVVNFSGNIGIVERATTTGQHKFGLYRGQQPRYMRIYHDAMRRGASFEEVNPASYEDSGSNYTLHPSADAYVRGGDYAGINYGIATALDVKGSSNLSVCRRSFLRWSLGSYSGTASSAQLRLTVTSVETGVSTTTPAAIKVYAVSYDTWVESGTGSITWNNQPALGTQIGSVSVTGPGTYDVPMTSHVNSVLSGDKIMSLAIGQDTGVNKLVTCGSRENSLANRPTLTLTGVSGP
jgi:hypothetical protein